MRTSENHGKRLINSQNFQKNLIFQKVFFLNRAKKVVSDIKLWRHLKTFKDRSSSYSALDLCTYICQKMELKSRLIFTLFLVFNFSIDNSIEAQNLIQSKSRANVSSFFCYIEIFGFHKLGSQ